MKVKTTAAIGIGACAAACAAGAILPLAIGGGAVGIGSVIALAKDSEGIQSALFCVLPLVAIGAAAAYYLRKPKTANSCASDGSCGCAGTEVKTP